MVSLSGIIGRGYVQQGIAEQKTYPTIPKLDAGQNAQITTETPDCSWQAYCT